MQTGTSSDCGGLPAGQVLYQGQDRFGNLNLRGDQPTNKHLNNEPTSSYSKWGITSILPMKNEPTKGRLQNLKTVKLGTLSQQEGGRSEGLPKCPNSYFEPEIQHIFVFK